MNSLLKKFKEFTEAKRKYIFIGIFSIIFSVIGIQFLYYLEIRNNKKVTIGKVIRYEKTIRNYTLYYIYSVNGKLYDGKTSVSYFEGNVKEKLCLGCSFNVYYSSKNPYKSTIYLNQFEKYKRTVEFFKYK